jgi:hypothetical protein
VTAVPGMVPVPDDAGAGDASWDRGAAAHKPQTAPETGRKTRPSRHPDPAAKDRGGDRRDGRFPNPDAQPRGAPRGAVARRPRP